MMTRVVAASSTTSQAAHKSTPTLSERASCILTRRPKLVYFLLLTSASCMLGALLGSAQYNSPLSLSGSLICDSSRLIRCQQDSLRDMQLSGSSNQLNSLGQYAISQGPPYSPSAKQQLFSGSSSSGAGFVASATTCRLIRSNLECLLQTTPACYDQGIQAAQNTDIILRAKRFLEQNNCNEPDSTWQSTFCYRSPEIRSCEERYGFTSYASSAAANLLASANNLTACLAYHAFKFCVNSHLQLNCKVHEMDMANEYLIDRASDLAWRCPANISTSSSSSSSSYLASNYQLNNAPGSLLSPSHYTSNNNQLNNYHDYQQRPIPAYVGSTGNLNLFSGSSSSLLNNQNRVEQAWERFRNPLDNHLDPTVVRYGVSRQPNTVGEVFDRLIAANNAGVASSFGDIDSSDCPVKAAPYARECEDTLMDQQRLARDSRDGNELQRRICCSLFQYRDCISRVVLDRCADSSPTAVEILMGVRRREMTLTCRSFNRDICSGSLAEAVLSMPMLLTFAILTSFMTLKQTFMEQARPSFRL